MMPSYENTIVIPTYSNYKGLIKCVKTLKKFNPASTRVIVVDQGPRDSWQELRGYVHLYLRSYRQLGFAKACNVGWRCADTPLVTFCNDDVEFIHSSWWDGICGELGEPSVIGVNPRSPRQYTMGAKVGELLPYKESWSDEDYAAALRLPARVRQCQAMFCTTIRQDLAEKVGKFDEFFFPAGGEDIDWIARAKNYRCSENRFRGYDVIQTEKSYVWHWWNQSAVDPTFIQARIQLRQKWGWDFDIFNASTAKILPPLTVRQL